jgi:hypothetical protein
MQPDTDAWSERALCFRSLSSIRERERASLKPDRDFTGLLHNPDSPSARDMLDVRNQAGVHHVQSAHRTEEKGAGTHLHEEQAARGSSSESDPESTIAHTRRCPVVYIRGRGCGRGCERERLSRVGESNRA